MKRIWACPWVLFWKALSEWGFIESDLEIFRSKVQEILNFEYFKKKIKICGIKLVNEMANKKVILKWRRTHGLKVNELLG
jgi:hypothetical protein